MVAFKQPNSLRNLLVRAEIAKHPKSFPILTPQTVLFNDEDFHSVKILETGQTVRSAGSQEEMSFL
jgi:hypothetical protein